MSNLLALLSSVLYLAAGGRAAGVRYLSACILAMTLLVTTLVLVPMGGGVYY